MVLSPVLIFFLINIIIMIIIIVKGKRILYVTHIVDLDLIEAKELKTLKKNALLFCC